MRRDCERVLLGCAGSLFPGGGSTPRSQRADLGSKISPDDDDGEKERERRLLRSKKSSWHSDLLRRPVRAAAEILVLGWQRSSR